MKIWGLLRILLGWIFLWAFIDKLWGLGFATASERAWLAGGSPTRGFLNSVTEGPFAEIFKSLAGNPIVDWLFMLGLLFVGLTLFFGFSVRLGSLAGIIMLGFIYLAGFLPPENNPIVDDHIIYIVVMLGLILNPESANFLGFGRCWQKYGLGRFGFFR
ncbi:MAG: hypothetical protein COV31_00375 [Candidatus Yanofskybacteria bacterium CG10_big_fil_rev_8_21_14_0_10_46_23]|uniref:DoxX family protein n=1 Tax=Candidatus Yanofskybacteria bacterium CG10_big_fil_rev_8_21_14_0_10_46_23 TaxID=1975098 RepID=A0A2H0R4U4_9BACT|nr:MAG: hypothetical protein COV31_00375 [Candidatus Yanofskybacteria bacterium CG10_big_fil_rev_8_21_14_0_10_46_23]